MRAARPRHRCGRRRAPAGAEGAIAREPDAVERILTEFEVEAGQPPVGVHHDEINRLFAGDSVEAVVAALEADGSDWARAAGGHAPEVAAQRQGRVPPDRGRLKSLADDLAVQYRGGRAAAVVSRGVPPVIVEKDNGLARRPAASPRASQGWSTRCSRPCRLARNGRCSGPLTPIASHSTSSRVCPGIHVRPDRVHAGGRDKPGHHNESREQDEEIALAYQTLSSKTTRPCA